MIFILSYENGIYTVSILENTNTLTGTFSYKANASFIKAENKKLYIGKDTSISCINIAKN